MALSSSVYLQSSTTEQTDTNTLDIGGTTTPNKVTILEVTGIFRGVILKWDEQLNLTNFDHYDIQVSDDQVSWYSLKNDGTDWKDTLNGTTTVYVATYTHSRIPLGGTADNPQPVTLYYRVRRVTKVGATGDWSDVAAGVAQAIDSGELAADSVYTNNLRAGIVTAEKIGAGEVTADKIAIGGARKIYNQTLAPNVAYANDIWYDANDTKWTHNLDIISSRGGAPSSVTTFDSTVGGAPSGNTSWGNTYGNIPSRAGWITTLYEGMTAIDGGRIKTDTLKSWNYIAGVQGSKFDLATGYIETGDGEFRGDMVIGSDEAERQLQLGSKGLLVKDKNGTIIHDLPDSSIVSGLQYIGHVYSLTDGKVLLKTFNSFSCGSATCLSGVASLSCSQTSTVALNWYNQGNVKSVALLIEGEADLNPTGLTNFNVSMKVVFGSIPAYYIPLAYYQYGGKGATYIYYHFRAPFLILPCSSSSVSTSVYFAIGGSCSSASFGLSSMEARIYEVAIFK